MLPTWVRVFHESVTVTYNMTVFPTCVGVVLMPKMLAIALFSPHFVGVSLANQFFVLKKINLSHAPWG